MIKQSLRSKFVDANPCIGLLATPAITKMEERVAE